jgi:hypothetical protein
MRRVREQEEATAWGGPHTTMAVLHNGAMRSFLPISGGCSAFRKCARAPCAAKTTPAAQGAQCVVVAVAGAGVGGKA